MSDPRIWEIEWHLQPLPIAIAFVLMLSMSVTTAPLWLIIYRGLGGKVGTPTGIRIFLVTNIGKYLPGKVMHAAGRVALLGERGQSASIGVTSVLVELALSLLGAALVSVISIPLLIPLLAKILLSEQSSLIADITEHLTLISWLSYLALPLGPDRTAPPGHGAASALRLQAAARPSTELCTDLPPYRTILLLLVAYVGALDHPVDRAVRHLPHRSWTPLDWSHLPAISGIAALSYLFGLAVPIAGRPRRPRRADDPAPLDDDAGPGRGSHRHPVPGRLDLRRDARRPASRCCSRAAGAWDARRTRWNHPISGSDSTSFTRRSNPTVGVHADGIGAEAPSHAQVRPLVMAAGWR